MRAPELLALDKLEELKKSLEKTSQNKVSFSPLDYKNSLLTKLKSKVSEKVSGDNNLNDDDILDAMELIQEALSLTLRLVDALIEKIQRNEVVSEKNIESILNSILADNSNKEVFIPIVLGIFAGILKDYRESAEKICAQYGLTLPKDNAKPVCSDSELDMDSSSSDSDDADLEFAAIFSLANLNEAKYLLDLIVNKSIEELSKLHPIKDAAFLRQAKMPDEIVAKIEQSQLTLRTNLLSAIENAQKKLNEVISANNYSVTTRTPASFVEQQTALLLRLEDTVAAIPVIRSQIQTSGRAEAQLRNATAGQVFVQFTEILRVIIQSFQALTIESMRAQFELKGTETGSMSSIAASSGVSPSQLGIRSKEESRFGIIERIINDLIAEINSLQVAAGESASDFKLKAYLHKLSNELQPFESMMQSMKNTGNLHKLVEKFNDEAQAFSTAMQQATVSARAATSTASALFANAPVAAARRNHVVSPEDYASSDDEKREASSPASSPRT